MGGNRNIVVFCVSCLGEAAAALGVPFPSESATSLHVINVEKDAERRVLNTHQFALEFGTQRAPEPEAREEGVEWCPRERE